MRQSQGESLGESHSGEFYIYQCMTSILTEEKAYLFALFITVKYLDEKQFGLEPFLQLVKA